MDNQEIVTSSNSTPTPRFQLMNFIETITKLFPILSILALIFGGVVTYTYLDNIRQTAIFPDILSSPSALLALILVFIGVSTIFLFSLITPYFVSEYLNQEKIPLIAKDKLFKNTNHYAKLIITNTIVVCIFILEIILDSDIKYFSFSIPCLIFILLVPFLLKKEKTDVITILVTSFIIITSSVHLWIETVEFKYIFSILFFMIFVGYIWQCTISQTKSKFERMKSFFIVLLCLPISFFVSTVFFILMAMNIAGTGYQIDSSWYLFIVFFVIWLLMYASNGFFAFHLYQNKKQFEIWHLFVPCMMLFLIAYVLIIFDKGRQLPRLILKPLHFIEYPSNTNWYTIDTRFFAPNNLNNQEIKQYSEDLLIYFYSEMPKSQCEYQYVENFDGKECKQQEEYFKKKEKYNRFYGYVAWNLGDIKVFCPNIFEKARLEANKQKRESPIRCLALKSEYIIPYY